MTMAEIKTSDIARLMELFQVRSSALRPIEYARADSKTQSSLLHYRHFEPDPEKIRKSRKKEVAPPPPRRAQKRSGC